MESVNTEARPRDGLALRTKLALVLVAAALPSGCGVRSAGLFVTVDGDAPAPVASLHVTGELVGADVSTVADFYPQEGESAIALPTSFGLLLRTNAAGMRAGDLNRVMELCVDARDDGDEMVASGCATTGLDVGGRVDVLVLLVARGCGDGLREDPAEECDGSDLGGLACADVGFSGGELTCSSACLLETAGCFLPTPPVPLAPANGAYLGSIHAPGSLRPLFRWSASTVPTTEAISYELEYATDPGFPAGTTTLIPTFDTDYEVAADLAVDTTPPVGTRYFWRVRACLAGGCSEPTPIRSLNVGRLHDDVNGDGYADIIVGAPGADAGGAEAGRAYLFLGGAGPFDGNPDHVLTGTATGDSFGTSVAMAGDLNGDGFGDVLIGAPRTAGLAAVGSVYVFHGDAAGLVPFPAATLLGEGVGDSFGSSVAAGGDLNGDGLADILLGARGSDAPASGAGRVYVFYGNEGATFDAAPDGLFSGEMADEEVGASVAGAGDLNGDGFDDMLVGAPGYGGAVGRAYVFYGGPGTALDVGPDVVLDGEGSGDGYGTSVAGAGDVNGDGFADLLVGAPFADSAQIDAGRMYVYFGGPGDLDDLADGVVHGSTATDFLGWSVAGIGDVNGDGFDDVAVGAPLADGIVLDTGMALVLFGSPATSFEVWPDGTLMSPGQDDLFGFSVAGAGDVDGDGFADLIVGAPQGGLGFQGLVALYNGGPGSMMDTAPDAQLFGALSADFFGICVD